MLQEFICSDKNLCTAAKEEGFDILNPEEEENGEEDQS